MKLIFIIFILLNFIGSSFGQKHAGQKTKIVLLGVAHFTPSPTDVYKSKAFDPESVKGHKEIMEVVNHQTHLLDSLYKFAKSNNDESQAKQQNLTLKEFLIFENSASSLGNNHLIYTKYAVKLGKEESYVGTNLVAEWFKTNLIIYTNILRKVQPTDKAILVIYGQGHVPIIKHLFESNPDFDVVEVKEILQ